MKIKFSHKYAKLEDFGNDIQKMAKLLEVVNVNLENLSEDFKNYDTDHGIYQLPNKGDYMMLIFFKNKMSGLFTTLRRRTEEKEKYYRGAIGLWFDIEIVEVKKK